MLIKEKEKENDLNHFNQAKKYCNSNPSDYVKSIIELNKISFLTQNLTIIHLKIFCLLMLSKYEEIVEYYYSNKKIFDEIFNKNENVEEKNEIKKILSLAFFNFNVKQKAKQICPDIKEEFNYKIEKFEINFLKKYENKGKDSSRISKKKTFTKIKNELDKNFEEIKKNKSKELLRVSSTFVENLFQTAKNDVARKNMYQNINNNINPKNKKEKESIIINNNSLNSNSSLENNFYSKIKNEISDYD